MNVKTPVFEPITRVGRPQGSQDIPWPARLRVLAVWGATLVVVVVILVARLPLSGQVLLEIGDVAARDIAAPRRVTYVSDILTEQRREVAASAVPDVYDPPQARIGREQLALASRILDYIATVRSDSYTDKQHQAANIDAIARLDLTPAIIDLIVAMPGPTWDRTAAEVQVVLERTMREEIRENNLADERRKVPARVRLDLSDDEAAVVSAIVQGVLVPNSFYNPERTEERRADARAAVEPVTRSFERMETVLRAGEIVSDLDIEALKALGLQQSSWTWQEVRAASGFVLLLGIVLLYYLWRQELPFWFSRTDPLVLALVTVLAVLVAKLMVPGRALLPYVFPYAALGAMLAIALNQRLALVSAGLFALLVGWLTGGNLEIMTYALAGAMVGVLKLRRGDRLAAFFWSALFVIVTNLLVVFVFRVGNNNLDLRGLIELAVASIVNGLATLTVALLGLYALGALFDITTPLQLLEISRPTHPLLRQLLLKAPGTYHHTLIVSNMAERAAETIGADPLLTRVGAYYHDVGKTIRPYFFVENRTENVDPHARLDPYTSAQIIITHVKDGIELGRKYRLPRRILEFIPEHQGTLLVSYFYHQAVQQAGTADAVDKAQFRYPGPRPQSRETAITMLADGAEATVRSRHPASVEEMEQIVAESIQARLLSGQLDECPLTVADLSGIRRAFVDVLRGLHHPRVAYPPEAGSRPAELPPASPAPALQGGTEPAGPAVPLQPMPAMPDNGGGVRWANQEEPDAPNEPRESRGSQTVF